MNRRHNVVDKYVIMVPQALQALWRKVLQQPLVLKKAVLRVSVAMYNDCITYLIVTMIHMG